MTAFTCVNLKMKCMKINPAEYKILVVDDVQSNVLLLKALLGREGFGCLLYTSPSPRDTR